MRRRRIACVVQHERLGTAHAALQAASEFGDGAGRGAVCRQPADPAGHVAPPAGAAAGAATAWRCWRSGRPIPARYGRVITGPDGMVERIVEYADATEAERAVDLCNAGVLCAPARPRWRAGCGAVRNDNAKGEYYLTDVVALARPMGVRGGGGRGAGGRTGRGQLARPNWRRRRRCCRAGCARRRWRPA